MRLELKRVEFMPAELELGVLYVAERFGAAAHLCACGCGSKVRTPLGPTEWAIQEGQNGVSLYPSVGNWQRPCRSHYWIRDGQVIWSKTWADEQISAGRAREHARREAHFQRRLSLGRRIWERLKRIGYRR